MKIQPYLLALFVLALAMGSIWRGLQSGHLIEALPEIAVHLSLAGLFVWRAWKITKGGAAAEHQTRMIGARWEEATSAALRAFCGCVILYVPLAAISGLHPETFHHIDPQTMLAVTFVIASAGAVLVGTCRFLWWD